MTETSPVVATTAVPDTSGFVGTAARSQWRTVAARFVRHRAALVGLVLFALLLLFAVGHCVVQGLTRCTTPGALERGVPVRYDRTAATWSPRRSRDPPPLQIALTVAVVATVLGVVPCALAGYRRGWWTPVGRTIDPCCASRPWSSRPCSARNTFTIAPGATN